MLPRPLFSVPKEWGSGADEREARLIQSFHAHRLA